MSQVFTPTIINEKTPLGQVVSLLKGLGRYFYTEDEKSIFRPKNALQANFLSKSPRGPLKIEKNDCFKISSFFTPTIINEKTQLGQVVPLLKEFGHYFYAEDEKSIFDLKIFIAGVSNGLLHRFYTGNGNEVQFLSSKIDFSSSA